MSRRGRLTTDRRRSPGERVEGDGPPGPTPGPPSDPPPPTDEHAAFARAAGDGAPWDTVPGPDDRDDQDGGARGLAAVAAASPAVLDVPVARADDEARLLERLVARDEQAFSSLVRAYERRVFALVVRMLGNRAEAEDLAQEVFVQVFKAVGTFRGESKLSTWIYRIAINLCKNRSKYLRSRHAGEQDELEAVQERAMGEVARGTGRAIAAQVERPDEMMAGRQIERIVQRAILALEPSFRECLVLRDVEDLSYEDIGQITGLPEGTVKSRIHRARSQLKELVEQALGEKIP